MTDATPGFEHANVKDFSNPFPALEDGFYNLQIVKSERRTGESEKGPYDFMNLQMRVVNSDRYSGRVIFSAQFPGQKFYHGLYKIGDVTGIEQEEGESIEGYLARVVEAGSEGIFKAKVYQKYDKWKSEQAGEDIYTNDVDLGQVQIPDAVTV